MEIRYCLNEGPLDMLLLLSMFMLDSNNLHYMLGGERVCLLQAAGLSITKEFYYKGMQ